MWLFAEWSQGEVLGAVGTILASLGAAIIALLKHQESIRATKRAEHLADMKVESEQHAKDVAERTIEMGRVLDLYKSERMGIYAKLEALQAEHMDCRKSEARLSAQNASQQKEIDRNTNEIGQLTKRLQALERGNT